MDWMLKQQLHTIERYGTVAASEGEIQTVLEAAKAASVEFANMGENGVCATTLASVPQSNGHGGPPVRARGLRCRIV